MKTKNRYELCIINDGIPRLVDVSSLGPSEGFDDTLELKRLALEAIDSFGLCFSDRITIKNSICELIGRLEDDTLYKGDVLDVKQRKLPIGN